MQRGVDDGVDDLILVAVALGQPGADGSPKLEVDDDAFGNCVGPKRPFSTPVACVPLDRSLRISDLDARNPQPLQSRKTIRLEELGALMGVEPIQSLEGAVLQIMRAHFPTSVPSESEVAAHLAIGPRSLQRALRAEGTSYRKIRSMLIEEQAREMLQKSDIPVERIAKMLGYKEPKSFRRAFREWTGSSPKSFRGNRNANI